jgi:RNA polymerase sigma-70 factor, ECF subfamily
VTLEADAEGSARAESERLAAARAGDEGAFGALARPFERELHVHCYRMLGSLDDADDALQETLLRAWRGLGGYEPRAPFRAWLYRIATNACLTLLARRERRGEVALADREEGEPVRLDPYPDRLLEELGPGATGPEALVEQRESVELAFVAAVQLLPPRQRATLLLRDVIGYTAAEVAGMLATSVAAVNSALQRARATLEEGRRAGLVTRAHVAGDAETERGLVRRLAEAWHAADVGAIVALLTEDALFTMPPLPLRVVGREAIGVFLATVPGGGRLDRFRLVPVRANRQPAFAIYVWDEGQGVFKAYGVMVVAIEDGAISTITRFGDPRLVARAGMPPTYEGEVDDK